MGNADVDLSEDIDLENEVEGINMRQLFSLAKKCPIARQKEEIVDLSDCEDEASKKQKTEQKPSLSIEKEESECFNALYDKA